VRAPGERAGHVRVDQPGATTLTVIPRDATSSASALLNPMIPAFDAA
jgi:hypothetical protein